MLTLLLAICFVIFKDPTVDYDRFCIAEMYLNYRSTSRTESCIIYACNHIHNQSFTDDTDDLLPSVMLSIFGRSDHTHSSNSWNYVFTRQGISIYTQVIYFLSVYLMQPPPITIFRTIGKSRL